MKKNINCLLGKAVCSLFVLSILNLGVFAQSRPQRPEPRKPGEKINQRPAPRNEEERLKQQEEERQAEESKNAEILDDVIAIDTKVVNIDAVVINKKTGQIITGLKRENFVITENKVKQKITGFSEPESPITVTLVLEYSKWTEVFGSAAGGYFEPGVREAVRPVAHFLTRFIKPPDDYASVIAFDMRPTPITDFTNDPSRINQTINLLLRNQPAFRENNLFDALKFALVGGRGDSVVLDDSEARTADYAGMIDVKSKRKAIILVASGIDTFSKINLGDIRKIIQEAGVPIYIISTGNLFYKRFEQFLPATDSISGMPGRLTFLQAQNQMNTFAKESGGVHYPMTFESEIPTYLNNINALLRSQYSLAYDLEEERQSGKRYKIDVKVDVDGDGVTDEKQFVVQHRPYYVPPKELIELKKASSK